MVIGNELLDPVSKKMNSKVKLEKSPNIELHELKALDQSFMFLQTTMQKM